MTRISKDRTSTAEYRMIGAVGAVTTLNNTGEPKNHKSRGNQLRMIYFAIAVLSLIVSANSCKTLSHETLSPKMKNERLLPPLTPEFDVMSFGTIFPLTQTTGSVYVGYYGSGNINASTSANPALNDLSIIFDRDVGNNICESIMGVTKGTIKCRAITGKHKMSLGWILASVCTAFIPNFFGMPLSFYDTELQIEVSILDKSNNIIGRYTSDMYKEKTYAAMYWGYPPGGFSPIAQQRNARSTFTACMTDIKRQIAKDYDRLMEALK